MPIHTTVRAPSKATRIVWLGLGLFFASLTARVLLADVHGYGDMTSEHYMTVGALVGAIAAGVWFWRMLKACKVLTAVGLGLAFAAATVYCMIGSAGRGDELIYAKNAAARDVNADRKRAERDQAEAKKRYEAALAAEEVECASGSGPKCTAKRETTGRRRSDLEVSDILLRKQPAEQRENGKLKRAAEIIAFFRGTDQATAERGLALLWPFIPPAVCELLTIVFLHLAFAEGSVSAVAVTERKPSRWKLWLGKLLVRLRRKPKVETVALETVATVDDPGVPPPGGGRKPGKPKGALGAMATRKPSSTVVNGPWRKRSMNEPKALAFVQGRLAAGDEFPSQDAIAAHCGVGKSAVSKWAGRWEREGLFTREKDGRCKVLALPTARVRA